MDLDQDKSVSKTQQKRILKKERIAEKYKERKLEKKKFNKSSNQEIFFPCGIRQERNAMIRSDFESKCERGPLVIIDCEWNASMTSEKELISLTQQIMYSYACNKAGLNPVRLWIVGASDAQKKLLHQLPGSQSWYMAVTSSNLDQLSLDPCSIYLTADSNNILDISDTSQSSAFIIGGIVDRNRHKNATLHKAESLGLATAQFPIGQYLPLKSSKVLTVNHVVQILVEVLGHHDWERAFHSVIPIRKRELDNP